MQQTSKTTSGKLRQKREAPPADLQPDPATAVKKGRSCVSSRHFPFRRLSFQDILGEHLFF